MTDEATLEDEIDGVMQLKWLLGLLRAQYWSYQHSHWIVRGNAAYGDHLLFQRLYESVLPQIDTLAEKLVGTYGVDALNSEDLLGMFLYWNERWDAIEDLHQRGLTSEEDLQGVIQDTYDDLKDTGELSLGMDDFLMSVASEHETNQYLLQQVVQLKQATSMANWVTLKEEV